jgi:hypothetical protein
MDRLRSWIYQPPQAKLTIFASPNYGRAKILRDSIINAVGNLATIETNSRKAHRAGKQTVTQEKNTTTLHRAQVQRLAALANEHAQLCYEFETRELLFANVGWTEDPTTRRALRGCYTEIEVIRFDFVSLHPDKQHPSVLVVIKKWYSPAFNCTEADFHWWVYSESIYLDALASYERDQAEAELERSDNDAQAST